MKNLEKLKPRRKALHIANVSSRALFAETLFEDFLRKNLQGGNEFRLVATPQKDGTLEFYIHPLGRDGSTFDGYSRGTEVYPKKAIDNLMKYLREKPSK